MDNTILSVRLPREIAERFWVVMDAVKARNAYIGRSVVILELLEVVPTSAVMPDEIAFFRMGSPKTSVKPLSRESRTVHIKVPTETIGGGKRLSRKPKPKQQPVTNGGTKKQRNGSR